MRLCVIPMKPLARAKERLADLLGPQDRAALSLAMLADVTASAVGAADEVWVLNSDDEAAAVAVRAGAKSVPDPAPGEGLNAALNAATQLAVEQNVDGLLVLSADIPAVTAGDVGTMLLGSGVAIAPNLPGTGTNALWREPPGAISCVFGEMSRRGHESLAHVNRVACAVVPLERIAVDVDVPRDLQLVMRIGAGPATNAALEALGYPSARR